MSELSLTSTSPLYSTCRCQTQSPGSWSRSPRNAAANCSSNKKQQRISRSINQSINLSQNLSHAADWSSAMP